MLETYEYEYTYYVGAHMMVFTPSLPEQEAWREREGERERERETERERERERERESEREGSDGQLQVLLQTDSCKFCCRRTVASFAASSIEIMGMRTKLCVPPHISRACFRMQSACVA